MNNRLRFTVSPPKGKKESDYIDAINDIKKSLRKAAPGNVQMGMALSLHNFVKDGVDMVAIIIIMDQDVQITISDRSTDRIL